MPRQRRQGRTLLEWNVLLAAAAEHGSGREPSRWSAHKALLRSTMKASRVGEFIGMWAIAKAQLGEVTTERVAEFWGMNERTAYRRLAEFREVWGPPGLKEVQETPDELADWLIADYRRRRQKLEAGALARMLSASVELPPSVRLA